MKKDQLLKEKDYVLIRTTNKELIVGRYQGIGHIGKQEYLVLRPHKKIVAEKTSDTDIRSIIIDLSEREPNKNLSQENLEKLLIPNNSRRIKSIRQLDKPDL